MKRQARHLRRLQALNKGQNLQAVGELHRTFTESGASDENARSAARAVHKATCQGMPAHLRAATAEERQLVLAAVLKGVSGGMGCLKAAAGWWAPLWCPAVPCCRCVRRLADLRLLTTSGYRYHSTHHSAHLEIAVLGGQQARGKDKGGGAITMVGFRRSDNDSRVDRPDQATAAVGP